MKTGSMWYNIYPFFSFPQVSFKFKGENWPWKTLLCKHFKILWWFANLKQRKFRSDLFKKIY